MQTVQVTQVQQLSPSVKQICVEGKIPFLPGQWMDVQIGKEALIGFSMTNAGLHAKEPTSFAVKKSLAQATQVIHANLKAGDSIQIQGPGGSFFWNYHDEYFEHMICVAGGIGYENCIVILLTCFVHRITPIISIIRAAHALHQQGHKNAPKRITLLYSASTQDEMVFLQDLQTMQPLVIVRTVESKKQGRITLEHVQQLMHAFESGRDKVYLCGPPAMLQTLPLELYKLGAKETDVAFEKWW